MYTRMTAPLPTGAYIIRNCRTSTVLHTEAPDALATGSTTVYAHEQDEGQFHNQQIWWVEPLADYTGPSNGTLYSINSPGGGKVLEADPESGAVFTNTYRGSLCQIWEVRTVEDAKTGEVTYTIGHVLNDNVLDIRDVYSRSVNIQHYQPGLLRHHWEFAIPVVAFPPGWFHIQVPRTGHLLSHDYAHNAPVPLPVPNFPRASEHRSTWQYQWTLCHSKCFVTGENKYDPWPKSTIPVERNSWRLINRLTRSSLSPHVGAKMTADFTSRDDNLACKLELDSARNWSLTNRSTSHVLTRYVNSVHWCTKDIPRLASDRQSWILGSLGPLVEKSTIAPHPDTAVKKPYSRRPTSRNQGVTTVRLSLLLRSTLRLMRGRLRA